MAQLFLGDSQVGGGDLYQHNLELTVMGEEVQFVIITKSSTVFTLDTLCKFLYEHGFTSTSSVYHIGNTVVDVNLNAFFFWDVMGLYSTNGKSTSRKAYVKRFTFTFTVENNTVTITKSGTVATSSEDFFFVSDEVIKVE